MNTLTISADTQHNTLTNTELRQKLFRFFVQVALFVSVGLMALALITHPASAANHTITIQAKGNLGSESVYLDINGSRATSWQVSNTFQTFSYTASQQVNSVRVGHNSGSWPNALVVDYIEVDGSRYHSDNAAIRSVGSWDSTTKCAPGYKQSKWLSCNGGYFDFATGSNLITVQARGNLGTENVDLVVNGSEIASWPLSNSNQTFEYRTNQNVDNIRVRNSSGGWPNAVVVDYVELNGKRYESEDASTLSYGSWDSVYGCAEGFKQSKWLSCDGGYFDYAIDSNLITVRARGNQGTENVDLIVNDSEVASWPLSNSNQTFEYRISQNVNSIKVSNSNGGWPNAVVVEYVELNGKRYESEDASTRSYGSWDSVYGCAEGYKRSMWLSCDGGYFQYAIDDDANNTTPLVIFDTDMGPDIDDAVALALLHSYQDAGKIEIAAVTVSRDSVNAARYIDAVNTHYGHPDIPIGVYRGGTVLADADKDRFTLLAANYSHDVDSSPIEDSYKVIRSVLANAAGRPVMIIQTGFSGSLSALMNSTADAYSSLSGPDLVADTVDTLYFMGARFDGSSDAEFNIKKDISSARNLFDKWPSNISVFPWDVGAKLFYPYDRGIRDKFEIGHIIRTAYENETLDWHRDLDRNPPADPALYNMASWDLNAVMHAVEPEKNYFKQGKKGTVIIRSDMTTIISENAQGRFTVYEVPDDRQRTINRMVEMVKP